MIGTALRRRLRARARGEDGLSLVELVVAITVLSVVLLGLAGSLASGLKLVRGNRQRVVAANLATQGMERVRSLQFTDIPLGRTETQELIDSIPYTVRQDVTWADQSSDSGACDGGTGLDFLRIDMTVFWRDMDGVAPVESQTIISPSAGSFDPSKGNIAVEVRDRDAAALDGQPVTISGPSGSDSQITTADGCAFFPQLTVGTYTVGVSRAGYVDGLGVAAPTKSLAVLAGATASWSFDFDQAATLSLTLAAPGGGTIPSGLPVTIRNDHLTGTRTKTFAGTGTSRTIGNLFPYAEGYEVWAGDCTDARPLDPDGTAPDTGGAVATEPGQTTVATVNLPSVGVRVTRTNGTPVVGTTVTAVHSVGSCARTYVVGTTDAAGNVVAAIPYGTWQFRVTVSSVTTTGAAVTVTPASQPNATVVIP